MRSNTIIIAEAGVNHNGSIELAKKLVAIAANSGADYVKFQTFKASILVSMNAKIADYQKNILDVNNRQYSLLKKLELSDEMHKELIIYCDKLKIGFLSSGFDKDSIDYLAMLGMQLYKIPSGEITNKPLLQHIANKNKPVILSTGMAYMKEIEDALDILESGGLNRKMITVLHCNTQYPTPMVDVNLKAMQAIKDTFNVKVGYSDHTLGIEIPIAAVAMGACVIEKHFTIDRNLPGPDHKASLEPDELTAMVDAIRNIEMALSGNGKKEPSPSELDNINVVRKSIHLKEDVIAGTLLNSDLLIMKRPGNGISPMEIDKVIGKRVTKNLLADTLLKWDNLEK